MLLDEYIKGRPVIDIDPETGIWRLATDEEAPQDIALAYLENSEGKNPIAGNYLDLKSVQYFIYWNSLDKKKAKFFFRTSEGFVTEIDGKKYAECIYATDTAGNPQPDHRQFSIYAEDGQLLYRTIYYSKRYEELFFAEKYGSPNVIYAADLTLGDWDFFVSVVDSFDYMKERRLEEAKNANQWAGEGNIGHNVAAGQPCPEAGWWFTPAQAGSRRYFKLGEIMPSLGGDYGLTFWQWSPDQSAPTLV